MRPRGASPWGCPTNTSASWRLSWRGPVLPWTDRPRARRGNPWMAHHPARKKGSGPKEEERRRATRCGHDYGVLVGFGVDAFVFVPAAGAFASTGAGCTGSTLAAPPAGALEGTDTGAGGAVNV